jgi:hypothetical protein
MRSRNSAFPRRRFLVSAGVAAAVAALRRPGQSEAAAAETKPVEPRHKGGIPAMSSPAQPDAVHFQPDGGINDAYLVNQLAGNGQSIDSLAFITSVPGGNLELLGRGGAGTFVKLNYLDGGGSERTGLAVSTGADDPIISIAPEANGSASLDLENNDLTGVETVVPSPDNHRQLRLDGLLALTPQPRPAVPASGGVLYVDCADGALKFVGSSGTVTTIAPG